MMLRKSQDIKYQRNSLIKQQHMSSLNPSKDKMRGSYVTEILSQTYRVIQQKHIMHLYNKKKLNQNENDADNLNL
jgi:hypothetical protein